MQNKKFLTYSFAVYSVFVLLLFFSGYFKIGFLSDDYMNFYDAENSSVGEKFSGHLTYANRLHIRPLTSLYIQASCRIHDMLGFSYDDFLFYRVEGLLLYLLISFLSGLILLHMTDNLRLSVILSSVILIFPDNIHSVCWTSGCSDMVCILFYLLSFYFIIVYLDNEKKQYLILSLVSFLAAMLSKEIAVTLPFVILVLVYYDRKDKFKKILKYLTPFFALIVLYFTYRIFILHHDLLAAGSLYQVSFLFNAAEVLAKSLISLTIPVDYLTLTLNLLSHEPLTIIYLSVLYGMIIYLFTILSKTNGYNYILRIFFIGVITLVPYVYVGYLRPQMIFLSFIIILIQVLYIYNKKIKLTLFLNKKIITVVFVIAMVYWTVWSVILVNDWKTAYFSSKTLINEMLKQDFRTDKENIIIGNKARVKQSFMFNQMTGAYNYWKYGKPEIKEKFNDLVQVAALDSAGISSPLNYKLINDKEFEITTTGKYQFFTMEGFDNLMIKKGFSNSQMSVQFSEYNELKKPVKMNLKLLDSSVNVYLISGYNIIKLQ